MDDERFGGAVRALRHRLALSQREASAQAGVSQSTWSLVERGRVDGVAVRTLRSIAAAVGAQWEPTIRWRGGELDRLLDEGHAALVGVTVRVLGRAGWETRVEVTFSVFGERGSIDVLAFHANARSLLVVEVKTALTSVEETLRRHDAKARLAPAIAAERFGWSGAGVARLLVLPDGATPRRRVARHATVLRRAYPSTGWEVRRWLPQPAGSMSGLLFLSSIAPDDARRDSITRQRVRGSAGRLSAVERQSSIVPANLRPNYGDARLDSSDEGDR